MSVCLHQLSLLYRTPYQQLARTPIQARPRLAPPPDRIPSIFDALQTPPPGSTLSHLLCLAEMNMVRLPSLPCFTYFRQGRPAGCPSLFLHVCHQVRASHRSRGSAVHDSTFLQLLDANLTASLVQRRDRPQCVLQPTTLLATVPGENVLTLRSRSEMSISKSPDPFPCEHIDN